MAKLKLEIPDEVLGALKLPVGEEVAEMCKELALALYQRRVLSIGKARILAQMTRWEFEGLLGKRKITRHYTNTELEEDIQYASGH
jgi:predicted HTH domain antitoxin